MTNEMPKEAGEWWIARNKRYKMLFFGIIYNVASGIAFREVGGPTIFCDEFDQYDWHKIELPEGWR